MRKFVKLISVTAIVTILLLILVASGVVLYVEKQLPDVDKLKEVHLQVPLRVYTADQRLIAQFGTKRRIPVTLNEVPKLLINAVLATEDARFYEHPGIDIIGIARASVAVFLTGKKVQGASTITMQVARNFYLSREKTYVRKVREILLALKIDREVSKNKILELYLNKIYFGNRAYGVAAAAKVYYGKELKQLSLAEMAMIAGLPQAPSRNNPLENAAGAIKRRNHVLARMLELGFISKAQYNQAVAQPLSASYHSEKIEVSAPYVAEMVRESMVEEYGQQAYEKGLTVYTTIQGKLQNDANNAIREGLLKYDRRHGFRKPSDTLSQLAQNRWQEELGKLITVNNIQPAAVLQVMPQAINALLANGEIITIPWLGLAWARLQMDNGVIGPAPRNAAEVVAVGDVIRVLQDKNKQWHLTQIPEVQGAIVALNPQDGAIFALTGGFDYQLSNFNRALQAQRQPGSNFKPFLYSAALNKGYTLATIINDAPIVQADSGEDELWRPTNDTLKFYGPTPLRIGLIKSRNLVSIRLLQNIGIPYTLDYVKRFGFDPNTLPHSLSLALGTNSATPLQISLGYAVFANGGYLVMPYFIQKIMAQHGEVLYQADPVQACTACLLSDKPIANNLPKNPAPRVITPQNAYLMTQAMQDVIQQGTGRGAKILNRNDLAGKTGTTNQQVDAWFSGFNSNLVATVWVGFDNSKSLKEYAAGVALPVWVQFMHDALENKPEATMPEPQGLITVRIDPETGLLAPPSSPKARFEIFRKKYAPKQYTSRAAAAASADEGSENTTGSDEQIF